MHELTAAGGTACAYGCDAADEASVEELFDQVLTHQGIPDLVVYSVQSSGPGEVLDVTSAAFEDSLRRNGLGSFLVARAAARAMMPRRSGTIAMRTRKAGKAGIRIRKKLPESTLATGEEPLATNGPGRKERR